MPSWESGLDAVGVALLLMVAYGTLLIVRRRLLARHGGTFEVAVRNPSSRPAAGWALGLGRYRGEELQWFRLFSPSPRPRQRWDRSDLRISGHRPPTAEEEAALYGGHRVVECTTARGPVLLAMSPSALTGLSAWLEAGPPGADWDRGPRR